MRRSRFVVILSLLLTVALGAAFLPTILVRADPVTFTFNATVDASIVNDGADSVTVEVTVLDNAVAVGAGLPVTLTITPSAGLSTTPALTGDTVTINTDAAGKVSIAITSTGAAATLNITASVSDNPPCGTAPCTSTAFNVTVLDATLPNQAQSTIAAVPNSVPADNTNSVVTVTLKNAAGTGIQGVTLTLAPDLAGPTVSPVAAGTDTTDVNGVATFNVKWLNSDLATSQLVNFVTGAINGDAAATFTLSTPVTFTTPALPAQVPSTVGAAPTSILANNTQTSLVSVTLLNAANAPVVDKTVSLTETTALGGITITPVQPVTNASGVATFTVQGTTAGSATFQATDTTDAIPLTADPVTITLVSPLPAEAQSTVSATPTSILANNTATSTIKVTLLTVLNTPVQGKTVTLTQTAGITGITILPNTPPTTDANGVVNFTVKGTTAGSATFKATDATDNIDLPNDTVTVTLVSPLPAEVPSTVSATPNTILSNNTDFSTVKVTLLDGLNNPVQGKTVTLTQTAGITGITILPNTPPTTDANGVVNFTVKGTTAGSATFKATDTTDNIELTNDLVTITLVTPPADKTNSTVSTDKATVFANNTDTANLTVTLRDAVNNPAAFKTVTLQADTPSGISVNGLPYPQWPTTLTTDAAGTATFTIKSNTVYTSGVKFTVTDSTDGVVLNDPADVMTIQFIQPAAAKSQSQVFADKTSVFANGTDSATITVVVRDVTGFPILNKVVSVYAVSFPGITINDQTPPTPYATRTTNGNGIVTFTVKSTSIAAGVTFVFRVDSDGVVLDDTADVPVISFVQPVPTNTATNTPTLTPTGPTPTNTAVPGTSAALSTVSCDYTQAPADGVFKVTISITLRDQNNQPVPNHLPIPSVIPQTVGLSFSSPALTDVNGRVTYFVSSVTQTAPNAILISVTDVTSNVLLAQTCTIIFGAPGSTPVVGPTPIGGLTLTPIGTITVTPSRTQAGLLNAADQGPITGQVVAYRLRVRTGPGLNYEILGLLRYKVTIVLLGRNRAGTWLLTQLDDGRQVWVSSRWIKISRVKFRRLPLIDVPPRTPLSPAATPTVRPLVNPAPSSFTIPSSGQGVGTANVAMLNAYDAPSADASVVGVLPRGTQMLILGKSKDGNWYFVEANADHVWVPATYVSLSKIYGETLGVISAASTS